MFPRSVFFYDLQLKIIKIQHFYKIILGKSDFGKSLEIFYIGVQPDGRTQIEFMAQCIQSMKDFFCPAVSGIITDYHTLENMSIFVNTSHYTKHGISFLMSFFSATL